MHYFLTNKFEYNISGIEHAQLYRYQLFSGLGVPAKVITFEFTPDSELFLNRHQMTGDLSLNMFDYWQGAIGRKVANNQLDYLEELACNDQVAVEYYDQERLSNAGYANQNLVSAVKYYDLDGHLTQRDIWDVRGFLSKRIFYNQDGQVSKSCWFDLSGQPVLVEQDQQLMILPANPQYLDGGQNSFTSWRAIKSAWLDQIVRNDSDAYFYIDRGEYVFPLVLAMSVQAKKNFVVLHSAHTVNRQDPLGSPFNDVIQSELNHQSILDGFIAATVDQARDFESRTGVKTYTIPVSYVSKQIDGGQLGVDQLETTEDIVYLSRISREKRIEDAIEAMVGVVETLPRAQLKIYGYVTDSLYNQELHELIRELSLGDNVQLLPYSSNRTAIFRQASLFVLTSEYEGFNMSLLEAASNGVPVVAYNVNYGPKALINTLQNGYLVLDGDLADLTEKMKVLLTEQTVQQEFQKNGLERAQRFYGKDVVAQQWLSFFKQMDLPIGSATSYVSTGQFGENNALKPANLAIKEYAEKQGYLPLSYPQSQTDWDYFLSRFKAGDQALLSYPSFVNTMNTNLGYDLKIVQALKAKGVRITLLVQDSLLLREWDGFENNEYQILNLATDIIVPTKQMKKALLDFGVRTPLLDPFYWYPLPLSVSQQNGNQVKSRQKQVIYAGNLDKAPFLEKIELANGVDVYGPNPSQKMIDNHAVTYHGERTLQQITTVLGNYSGFGLVWDGDILPGMDRESRYTRYNISYKAIHYLRSGLPLIAWSESSIGDWINEYGLGITVNNLNELSDKLNQLKENDLKRFDNNVDQFRHKKLSTNQILKEILIDLRKRN